MEIPPTCIRLMAFTDFFSNLAALHDDFSTYVATGANSDRDDAAALIYFPLESSSVG